MSFPADGADTLIIAPVPWCKVFQARGCSRPGSEQSRPDVLRFMIGGIPRGVWDVVARVVFVIVFTKPVRYSL